MSGGGRPEGRIIHAEAVEALLACRTLRIRKRDLANRAGISPSFLSDLLARRAGASDDTAQRIADALEVPAAAIFPGLVGWTSPLPDRNGRRGS